MDASKACYASPGMGFPWELVGELIKTRPYVWRRRPGFDRLNYELRVVIRLTVTISRVPHRSKARRALVVVGLLHVLPEVVLEPFNVRIQLFFAQPLRALGPLDA